MHAFAKYSSVSAALLLAVAAGCASPERQPAVKAVGSLADTRTQLMGGKNDIDAVVAAVAELESRPANLTPAYNRYKSAVTAVEHRAETVGDQVRDMRSRSSEYRAKWSEENAQITDPSLRATADERRQRVAERYDKLDRDAQELRAAYDPFIAQLHDVQTVLANDLTYSGVDAARPGFDKVRSGADKLRSKVDSMIGELDDAQNRLSPTTKPVNP
jgi:chromosome segregation ATPase